MKKKIITRKEYNSFPGAGAVSLLNAIGEDGQPILKYAKITFNDGSDGIIRYWVDENGKSWRKLNKFIDGNEY
jgi:hypothetical protein